MIIHCCHLLFVEMFLKELKNRKIVEIYLRNFIQRQNIWENIAKDRAKLNWMDWLRRLDLNIMAILSIEDCQRCMADRMKKS